MAATTPPMPAATCFGSVMWVSSGRGPVVANFRSDIQTERYHGTSTLTRSHLGLARSPQSAVIAWFFLHAALYGATHHDEEPRRGTPHRVVVRREGLLSAVAKRRLELFR